MIQANRPAFRVRSALPAGLLLLAASLPAAAQQAPAPPQGLPAPQTQASDPPYEAQLQRLAEILGALHYLRPLCGADEAQVWREQMGSLLEAEDPNDRRRRLLIDRFNLGYSSFASVYRSCTPAAALAADRYQKEGARISRDIGARYGR